MATQWQGDPKLLGEFGPPPRPMDLTETQFSSVYATVISTAILGTLAVVLRFYSRRQGGIHYGASYSYLFAAAYIAYYYRSDDWLCLIALGFAWGTCALTFVSVHHGNGRHLWALSIKNFTAIWINLFVYVSIYATTVSFTKASIVMFYRRIFNLKQITWVLMFIVVTYPITVYVVIFTACKPLHYFWTQYTDLTIKGKCIDTPRFFFANGVWAACIDVVLLFVPMPIIWKLQMKTRQKLVVIGILLLGSFVCIASVVRIVMLDRNVKSDDPTWTMSPIYIWSSVEPFVGIICACLPTLSPLIKRWWGNVETIGPSKQYSGGSNLASNSAGSNLRKGNGWGRIGYDDELMLTTRHDTTVIGDATDSTKAGSDEGSRQQYQMHHIHVQNDVEISEGPVQSRREW